LLRWMGQRNPAPVGGTLVYPMIYSLETSIPGAGFRWPIHSMPV